MPQHRGKDDDENKFKGFSRAGGRPGQSPEVADDREACIQVEGAISKASGRTRCTTELTTAASLRIQPLCRPADLSGDGCGGKRRRDQARDVRGESARLPGIQLQTSQRRGIRTRFSLADHRDLPERGRIGIFNRSYYEEALIVRVHPEILRSEGSRTRRIKTRRSGGTGIVRSWPWRNTSTATEPYHQVLPSPLERGATKALSGADR